jgi:hypothetical protein
MNCELLARSTGWECISVGVNALQLHAPLTLGDDGELASFLLLEDAPGTFFLTDAHATAEHAVAHGVRLTPARLQSLRRTPGTRHATISDEWEITASGRAEDLRAALWDALKIAMALSGKEREWQPSSRQERFATKVQKALIQQLGERLILKYRVLGSSGHQLEFPLGIATADFVRAVQPVGLMDDGRPDWSFVYQCFGKFGDLAQVSAPEADNRLVIVEAGNGPDWEQAVSLLSGNARVIQYLRDEDLRLAA